LVVEETMKVAALTDEERGKLQFLNELYAMREEAGIELLSYKRRLFEKHFPESRAIFSNKWQLDQTGTYIVLE
jgi:hypothetical protein